MERGSHDFSQALRRVQPGGALEEAAALAEIEARLFGRRERPRLRRYELLRRIGAGGIGVVYAAYDPQLEREVAIKLLQPRGDGIDRLQRLVREGMLLARVTHDNVVAVFDVGRYGPDDLQGGAASEVAPEGAFVVMELVHGVDLRQWLAARPRTSEEILERFLAAGRGLAAAHAQGIVHRDFKPANVLVGDGGEVKVVDFGLARSTMDPASVDPSITLAVESPASGCVTQTGLVLGTPAYMAPEQHRGVTVDARADQYSFCASLVEALYGSRWFHGADGRGGEPSTIGRLPREFVSVPAHVRRALDRGLDPDPARRFPSMDALLRAMQPTLWRRMDRLAAVGGGVAAIALALALVAAGGEPTGPAATAFENVASTARDRSIEHRIREAYALEREGRSADARRLLDQAYFGAVEAGAHLPAARAAGMRIAVERAQLPEARRWVSSARAALERAGGDRATADMIDANFASALMETGRPDEAEPLLRGILDRRAREGVPEDWRTATHQADLGLALLQLDRIDEAAPLLEASLELRRRELGDAHPDVAAGWDRLAQLADARGDLEAALEHERRALAVHVAAFGEDHAAVAGTMSNVARILVSLERWEEAVDVLQRALAILEALDAEHPHLDFVRVALAQAWAGLGRAEAARTLLRSTRDAIGVRHGFDHPALAEIDATLAGLG